MTSDTIELTVGDRIPGHKWVVVRKIAQGGMGATFEVVKPPGIRGVMKVILPSLARRREFVDRFFEEVRVLTLLQHPNIVQVIDHDLLSDGTPFFVMERLEGKTLRDALRRRTKVLPPRIVYEVMRQLCDGLYRVHSHEPPIVHRDIKPANLFLHQPEFADPALKILDFGVASILGGDRKGEFFGTPRYAAPEQLRNERVTLKADLYAVGLILYEMLAGRGPFDDCRAETAPQLHRDPPPARTFAPWIPANIDALLAQVLSRDPAERPRDAYALISKLFELQWVSADAVPMTEINTTAPTLILDDPPEEDEPRRADRTDEHDATYEGMTPPPIGGHTLELAPADPLMTAESPVKESAWREMSPNTLPASEPKVGPPMLPAHRAPTAPAVREDGVRVGGASSEAGIARSVGASSHRLGSLASRRGAKLLAAVGVAALFAGLFVLRLGPRPVANELAAASSTFAVAAAVPSSVPSAPEPSGLAAASSSVAVPAPSTSASAAHAEAKGAARSSVLPLKSALVTAPRPATSAAPDDGRDLLFDPSKR
jgi:serine/threonine protein kinase